MATIKICDFPECACTDNIETFTIQGESMEGKDLKIFDLCPKHQTMLIRSLIKYRDFEIRIFKTLIDFKI